MIAPVTLKSSILSTLVGLNKIRKSIHEIHISHGCIDLVMRHHYKFTLTIYGSKCGFRVVSRLEYKLMICRPQINLEKTSVVYSWLNKSSIWDKGYLFFMVMLLNSLKSIYNPKVLSFFFTYKTGVLHSDTFS